MLIKEIIEKAADFFQISVEEIANSPKRGEISRIRQFISALGNELRYTDDEISLQLNVDRTSITNARRRFETQYNQYPIYKGEYDEFKDFAFPAQLKLNKKVILAFPTWDEYENMSTSELALVKQKLNILEDHVKRIIRKRIQ